MASLGSNELKPKSSDSNIEFRLRFSSVNVLQWNEHVISMFKSSHQWLQRNLSKWQFPVQPISSKWRYFRFSVRSKSLILPRQQISGVKPTFVERRDVAGPNWWTHEAIITSLLRGNPAATPFWRNSEVIARITSCVHWVEAKLKVCRNHKTISSI